ncbi:hypothetical protein LF1_22680 [Rubripirellula obstinata]|uniref:Uncharacterized protein n=1 Tax=Rubripirellula obstinata TaxID=406547 RepID=A0A5B1CHP1_9BACT|nr:hypothetical protein [Rubripirellula obstinata]KAA1259731.1 hypothetical protein LF1_22680 [Rubripirellula obstinata]
MNRSIASTLKSTSAAIAVTLIATVASLTGALVESANAADPSSYLGQGSPIGAGQHRLQRSDMPPGYIGAMQRNVRGPVMTYFQPVAFHGPGKTEFALSSSDTFMETEPDLEAGLMVGSVYRFKMTTIPGYEGAELYPTIEVIDRTYPPPGLATKYPIEVYLDEDDIQAALDGQMVTRVVYLEDPQTASPLPQTQAAERPIETTYYQDALEVADRFGRPVAIVRIGSVAPPRSPALMPRFFFGSPAWAPIVKPEVVSAATQYPATQYPATQYPATQYPATQQ